MQQVSMSLPTSLRHLKYAVEVILPRGFPKQGFRNVNFMRFPTVLVFVVNRADDNRVMATSYKIVFSIPVQTVVIVSGIGGSTAG